MIAELLLLLAMWLGVTLGASICARLTRADRNYYPMQRVIWTAFSAFGALAAAGIVVEIVAGQRASTIVTRLAFAGILLGAILYSARFMVQRNRVARYVPLRLDGQPGFVDQEELRACSERVTSVIAHGAAPESWVAGMEAACAEWRRLDRWKREALPAQVAGRRERRAREAGERPV